MSYKGSGIVQCNSSNNIKRGDATIDSRCSNQTTDGTSLHHVNRCVEVEHSETPFDYQSLISNTREITQSTTNDGMSSAEHKVTYQ
jgi:hypothetical protein